MVDKNGELADRMEENCADKELADCREQARRDRRKEIHKNFIETYGTVVEKTQEEIQEGEIEAAEAEMGTD